LNSLHFQPPVFQTFEWEGADLWSEFQLVLQ